MMPNKMILWSAGAVLALALVVVGSVFLIRAFLTPDEVVTLFMRYGIWVVFATLLMGLLMSANEFRKVLIELHRDKVQYKQTAVVREHVVSRLRDFLREDPKGPLADLSDHDRRAVIAAALFEVRNDILNKKLP